MNKIQNVSREAIDLANSDWWRGGVLYQIYPRSFQDSNGDGVGDLQGIVQRLPYIASLGVDAIWISPFFTSPMEDFGYDVSDYCNVDPLFGNLADYDAVVKTAHKLGVRVIIDQVMSHTSDQHPWFVESRASRDNPKSDWYVWADPKADGTPPNNWLSIFGGSAWQWDGQREQYFLHNFLSSQPDLNFHSVEVQDALLQASRFWLDRGTDGFRLDTINFFFADKQLRDNPALSVEERNDSTAPSVNPYNYQNHIHSKNQPENLEFLRRYRAMLDEYPAVTAVGEVGDSLRSMELIGQYTAGNSRIHMCYAFDFLATELLSAARLAEIFKQFNEVASEGWPCWALTNHDVQRHVTRWNLTPAAERCYITLLMCLRGTPCLYQGEELGLPEANIEFEDLQDPYGKEFWPEFKGRDGCRTPMVWESSNQYAGFSTATTWLPVSAEHIPLSVAAQEKDATALLHHYRRAIAFRRQHECLRKGEQSVLSADGNLATFSRSNHGKEIFCAFNLGNPSVAVRLPAGEWRLLGAEMGNVDTYNNNQLMLQAWQVCIAIKC